MCVTSMTRWAGRVAVGRAIPLDGDTGRALPAGLHGLYRPEPGAGGDGAGGQRPHLVEPRSLHRAARRQDRYPARCLLDSLQTSFARKAAYADLVRAGITPEQQGGLTRSVLSGWALGEGAFVAGG